MTRSSSMPRESPRTAPTSPEPSRPRRCTRRLSCNLSFPEENVKPLVPEFSGRVDAKIEEGGYCDGNAGMRFVSKQFGWKTRPSDRWRARDEQTIHEPNLIGEEKPEAEA